MRFIFGIPLGIKFFIIVIVLLFFRKKFKSKYKLINTIIYIVTLVFISSLMYSAFRGFPYPCPCGACGSQEIDYGLKGIISFFTKSGVDLIVYEFPYFSSYVILRCAIIHIIVLSLKHIIKFIKNKR